MALELLGEVLRLMVLAGIGVMGILLVLIWKKDKTARVSYLRVTIQLVSVVAIFYLFTYSIWLLLMLGIILLMTIVFGRFFCGWLCPFGLYMDVVTAVRKAVRVRYRLLSERLNRALHVVRYGVLVFFLVFPFFLGPIAPWQWSSALFLNGQFKSISVLLGPLEPLIIPWSAGLTLYGVHLSYPYVTDLMFYTSGIYLLFSVFGFLAATLVGSFFVRRFWCRFCPTGASIAVVNRFKGFKWAPVLHIHKVEEKCTKCGICKRVCPLQVTEVYEQKGGKITTSMCMLCLRCVEMCPYEDTLKVKFAGKTVFKARDWTKPSESE